MSRLKDLCRLYAALDRLEQTYGARRLGDCDGKLDWPKQGVYFFRDIAERRIHTGKGARIVRVGTHALTATSKTTLWQRLAQHKGSSKSGGGNHRGSIFRLLAGC